MTNSRFTEDVIKHENGFGDVGWQGVVWDEDQGSLQVHCYGYGGDRSWQSEGPNNHHLPVIYHSKKKALEKAARFARSRNKDTWVPAR